ncbi:hypothetical protein Patl1_25392 [Pistacia atlantica]|uniref:Uncharacterized protein n=1 Tax=Pistacia atlantica TaxID=434234 RepID=A0ACC1B2Q3_9ROSI|nr:hypothetical protein Patl1_25392 [Pistacia atlantica]
MGFCPISQMVSRVVEMLCLRHKTKVKGVDDGKKKKIKGTIVLMKKNVLDFNDMTGFSYRSGLRAAGQRRFYSAYQCRSCRPSLFKMKVNSNGFLKSCYTNEGRGKLGKVAYVENWISSKASVTAKETEFTITFDWDENMGCPGAFIIRNHHHSQFYLKTLTLKDVPGHDSVHFVCNSWVYPTHRYKYDRVFFSNKVKRKLYA